MLRPLKASLDLYNASLKSQPLITMSVTTGKIVSVTTEYFFNVYMI